MTNKQGKKQTGLPIELQKLQLSTNKRILFGHKQNYEYVKRTLYEA